MELKLPLNGWKENCSNENAKNNVAWELEIRLHLDTIINFLCELWKDTSYISGPQDPHLKVLGK